MEIKNPEVQINSVRSKLVLYLWIGPFTLIFIKTEPEKYSEQPVCQRRNGQKNKCSSIPKQVHRPKIALHFKE